MYRGEAAEAEDTRAARAASKLAAAPEALKVISIKCWGAPPMVKRQLKACVIVSLLMALVVPIISSEMYVAANGIQERPDRAAYAATLEGGSTPLETAAISMRNERITYRFSDWYSFSEYARQVLYYFFILFVATLLVSGVRLHHNRDN